jgi:hypothetical protein
VSFGQNKTLAKVPNHTAIDVKISGGSDFVQWYPSSFTFGFDPGVGEIYESSVQVARTPRICEARREQLYAAKSAISQSIAI